MSQQLKIDFDYDDRCERLSCEFALMLAPYLSPGTPRETTKGLAGRLSMLAQKRFSKLIEPVDPICCHCCDTMTGPDERARVVVCVRCGMTPMRTPGSDG